MVDQLLEELAERIKKENREQLKAAFAEIEELVKDRDELVQNLVAALIVVTPSYAWYEKDGLFDWLKKELKNG